MCLAGTRVLVHRSVDTEFIARLADHARQLVVGDPLQAGTDLGTESLHHVEHAGGNARLDRETGQDRG